MEESQPQFDIGGTLSRWLRYEARRLGRAEDVPDAYVLHPSVRCTSMETQGRAITYALQVPQQDNDYDCGLWAVHYARTFMAAPEYMLEKALVSPLLFVYETRSSHYISGTIVESKRAQYTIGGRRTKL